MQAKKRFALLGSAAASLFLLAYLSGTQLGHRGTGQQAVGAAVPSRWPRWLGGPLPRLAVLEGADPQVELAPGGPTGPTTPLRAPHCRMTNCFDSSLCARNGFRVYVYPTPKGEELSESYQKIVRSVRESRHFTADPRKACLFVLGSDTLDRDQLSRHFVHGMRAKVQALPHWNGGRNHLVFNLYSGTWPNYTEDLGFDLGQAMLAKASISLDTFRPGFDVSIPLFPEEHPQRGGARGHLHANDVLPVRKYLLVFKGKRYLTGIGSDTRNALYHVNNGRDIVLLTTCRHGKDWSKHKDARCDRNNEDYERSAQSIGTRMCGRLSNKMTFVI